MSLDGLINSLGGCGLFQVLLVLSTYSTQLCVVWGMMFMAFGNYLPQWSCTSLDGHSNHTSTRNMSMTRNPRPTYSSGGETNDSVYDYSDYEENVTGLKDVGLCDALAECESVEFSTESSTIVTQWVLVCDNAWPQSVIICVQMVGVFIGAYFCGWLGDRIGRRMTLYGSVAIHALGNLLAIASVSWEMFACVRLLIGLSIGGVLSSSYVMPLEFVNEWWRGVVVALPMWNLGAAIFSILVYFVRDWKHIHIATAIFSAVLFLPFFWVPESLRWLVVHRKLDKAKHMVHRLSRINRKPPPDVNTLEAMMTKENMDSEDNEDGRYSLMDLFKDKSLRKISIMMGILWAFISLIYYAISFGIKNFSGDFYINFIIFSVAEIPGMIFVAPASNRLGRRLSSLIYFFFIALACLSVVVVNFAAPESIRGIIITVMALLAKMHILAVWMIVTVFCTELYPTVIRNLSIGYLNSCARIGGVIAPYLIPNVPEFLWLSYLVMGVILLAGCCLLMSLPETKGRPLPEIIKRNTDLSERERRNINNIVNI